MIESEELVMHTATCLKQYTDQLQIPFVFKASFDKANRTSTSSYRGPGIDKGLQILAKVRDTLGVPVITDVHEDTPN